MAGSVYLVPSSVDDMVESPAAAAVLQVLPVPPPGINAKNTVGNFPGADDPPVPLFANNPPPEVSDAAAAAAARAWGPHSLTLQDNNDRNATTAQDPQSSGHSVGGLDTGGGSTNSAAKENAVILRNTTKTAQATSISILAPAIAPATSVFTLAPTAAAPPPVIQIGPEIQLLAPDGAAGDGFGVSVDISGDIMVVGAHLADDNTENTTSNTTANRGSAYVYMLAGDGVSWTLQTKLMASDGTKNHYFGISVAVDGDTMAIGADGDDGNGNNSGSAYVYIRFSGGWTEQTKLTASDGAMKAYFGNSVAISRDTIVVGAWNGDTLNAFISGKAYIYTRSGDLWTEQTVLTASDGAESDYSGVSVAINRDTIVVGAQKHDSAGVNGGDGTNSGCAYGYTRSSSAGVWTEQTNLTASDGAGGDWFGSSVAVDGDTIVVGADHADITTIGGNGYVDSGGAYVYTSSSSSSPSSQGGRVWTEQTKLTPSDAATGVYFGDSVAIDGDVIVVAADKLDEETEIGGTGSGHAHVYMRFGDIWTEHAILTASDGVPYDGFGDSVAIDGDMIVVGGDETGQRKGSAYIF